MEKYFHLPLKGTPQGGGIKYRKHIVQLLIFYIIRYMEKAPTSNEGFKDPIYRDKFTVGGLIDFGERFKKVHHDKFVREFIFRDLGLIVGTETDSRTVARRVSQIILDTDDQFWNADTGGFSTDEQNTMAAALIEALVVDPEKRRKTVELEKHLRELENKRLGKT